MFKKRENWFHSIKRSPFSKNTTERSPLCKIPLKESFRSKKYHSVNFCNEPVILLSIGQSEMSLLPSSSSSALPSSSREHASARTGTSPVHGGDGVRARAPQLGGARRGTSRSTAMASSSTYRGWLCGPAPGPCILRYFCGDKHKQQQ